MAAAYQSSASMLFDVGSDSLVLPYESQFFVDTGDKFTFETIIRCAPTAADTTGIVYGTQLDRWTNQTLWQRIEPSGNVRYTYRGDDDTTSSQAAIIGTTNLFDNQWHHIAAVRDPNDGLSIYIDHNLEAKVPVTDSKYTFAQPFTVATLFGSSSREFDGQIDTIKITREALTPQEFLQPVELATNPSPIDGATGVMTDVILSWSVPQGVTSQTVTIATDMAMQNVVISEDTDNNNYLQVSGLSESTVYYWRVDILGIDFERTGQVWSFQTPECALTLEDGDLNGDCIINVEDLMIMASNWLKSEYVY